MNFSKRLETMSENMESGKNRHHEAQSDFINNPFISKTSLNALILYSSKLELPLYLVIVSCFSKNRCLKLLLFFYFTLAASLKFLLFLCVVFIPSTYGCMPEWRVGDCLAFSAWLALHNITQQR